MRVSTCFGLLGLMFVLNGCGGSGSTFQADAGGKPLTDYQATLPDGSPMLVEVLNDKDGLWEAEFVVAAETGPYALQTGSMEGTISGRTLTATGEIVGGNEFQLTGTLNSDGTWTLTRSDIPGSTLTFHPVPHELQAQARGEVSFNLNTGAMSGRVVLNSTPYAIHSGGEIVEYRGTWNNLEATFWAYRGGQAALVIRVDPLCIATNNFSLYRISDFPTSTVTSGSGQMTMYSTITKQMIKFKTSVTASP